MPQSGIRLATASRNAYNRVFKNSSKQKKLPYAIFMFNESKTEVIVDESEVYYEKELPYDDLLAVLPSDEPRFLAFDFEHLNKDKTPNSTVIFVSWAPSVCTTKQKFLVGTTFMSLVNSLDAKVKFEGSEISDLNAAEVCSSKQWLPVPAEHRRVLQGRLNILADGEAQ